MPCLTNQDIPWWLAHSLEVSSSPLTLVRWYLYKLRWVHYDKMEGEGERETDAKYIVMHHWLVKVGGAPDSMCLPLYGCWAPLLWRQHNAAHGMPMGLYYRPLVHSMHHFAKTKFMFIESYCISWAISTGQVFKKVIQNVMKVLNKRCSTTLLVSST